MLQSAVTRNRHHITLHSLINIRIREEVEAGHTIDPLPDELKCEVQISHFGVIPKPHQPGKWRLSTDLFSKEGSSINDMVAGQLCSLMHTSVEEAVSWIKVIERGDLC